jgi:hypothetical protein
MRHTRANHHHERLRAREGRVTCGSGGAGAAHGRVDHSGAEPPRDGHPTVGASGERRTTGRAHVHCTAQVDEGQGPRHHAGELTPPSPRCRSTAGESGRGIGSLLATSHVLPKSMRDNPERDLWVWAVRVCVQLRARRPGQPAGYPGGRVVRTHAAAAAAPHQATGALGSASCGHGARQRHRQPVQ